MPSSRKWRLSALSLCTAGLIMSACSDADSPGNHVQFPGVTEGSVDSDAAPPAAPDRSPSEQFRDLPSPYSTANYERGRRTFRLCQSCHTLAPDAPDLVGPNLYGLFRRTAGGAGNYAYSQALRDADFVWTPDRLDEWLANPRSFLPGNKMSFAGVRKAEDRTEVIAYIMLETGYTASSDR